MGNIILQKIFDSETPNVLAALIMSGLSCSKAPRVVRYISGNETITAEIIAACHVKTKLTSNCKRNFPTSPRLPKISSKKNPTTVGGKIIGKVNTASANPLNLLRLTTARAKKIPRKNVMTVATSEVFSVMINGLSISSTSHKNNFVGGQAQKNFVEGELAPKIFFDLPTERLGVRDSTDHNKILRLLQDVNDFK